VRHTAGHARPRPIGSPVAAVAVVVVVVVVVVAVVVVVVDRVELAVGRKLVAAGDVAVGAAGPSGGLGARARGRMSGARRRRRSRRFSV